MWLTVVAVKVWLIVMAVLEEKQMVDALVMRLIEVVVEVRLMLVAMRLTETVEVELMVVTVKLRLMTMNAEVILMEAVL